MSRTVKWILCALATVFVLAFVIALCNRSTGNTTPDDSPSPSSAQTNMPDTANGPGNVRVTREERRGRAADIAEAANGVVKVREAGGDGKFIVVVNVEAAKHPEKMDLSWKVKSAKNFAESAEKAAYAAEQGWRHTAVVWGAKSSLTSSEHESAKNKRALANQAKAEYARVLREEGYSEDQIKEMVR